MEISGIIILKKGRDQAIKRFHPWVFSGAIHKQEGDLRDGDWVEVQDSAKDVVGYGHYQKGSITVRILHFGKEKPTAHFWREKIEKAQLVRLACGIYNEHTNAFRLIHGEGDGLPGLIIDFYHGVAVVQAHSFGMHNNRKEIATALTEVLKDSLTAVYYKSMLESSPNEYLFGMSVIPHTIQEHGHQFLVDWEEGQKTGFYLDQRENRNLLGHYAKGKTFLNTFSYSGGFSVYALRAGAERVHSVDASEKAIDLCRKNIELNGFKETEHPSTCADVFDFMKDKKDVYDVIVLDPPAFAKHKEAKHQAMKGYQRLNAEAFRLIRPGGIVFTFSCSGVVDRKLFYDTVVSSAIQSGREIKVLHHLSQPADHPVSIYHPEGEYLKGLVVYVH